MSGREPVAVGQRPLGSTGLRVPTVGLGGGHLGGELGEAELAALLHGALDAGVTLIDTAPSYGQSEERIGRLLRHRRHEFVLSTKGGYAAPDAADWTAAAITNGIEAALGRLQTEQIDIYHLHSCPLEVLQRDDLLQALSDARTSGKLRVAAYSGENEALAWAISSGQFGCVQTSVNLCDQRGLEWLIPDAAARGIGVLGKRPLANMAWRYRERPHGTYAEVYWERLQQLGLGSSGDLFATALRFAAYAPGVSSILVGTHSLAHLQAALAAVAAGPLPESERSALRAAFAPFLSRFFGQI